MTIDYDDLDRRLRGPITRRPNPNTVADAIAALRSQMKMQEEVQTGFFKVAMDRAEKAEADNAALKQDADRYRWLRPKISGIEYRRLGLVYSSPDDVDGFIDAAKARTGLTP